MVAPICSSNVLMSTSTMPRAAATAAATLGQTKELRAQIQVRDIPNEIKADYSGALRCPPTERLAEADDATATGVAVAGGGQNRCGKNNFQKR